MSTHKCPVVRIKKEVHPNADALSIMEIGGFNVCIRSEDWKDGQLAAHIPADYWVPDTEDFAWLKSDSSNWQRTRTKRFRGMYSYGFLVPLDEDLGLDVGDNAMEYLDVIRYEPPENTMAGDNESPPEGFFPKYDVENYQGFKHLMQDGEEIVFTEKIHGCNARFMFKDGRMWAGSRVNWKKQDASCLWWKAVDQNPWIAEWCEAHPEIVVYGEVFGNVQSLKYGAIGGQMFFRAFDLLDGLEWLSYDDARSLAGETLQWVPELYRGVLDIELLNKMILEDSTLAKHMMEGGVIRPVVERTDPEMGRVFVKLVSPRYLEKSK